MLHGNQRWTMRRDTYRPPTERIRTSEYDVAALADDTTPKAFVQEHHYSGTYPAARFRFGLYRRGSLVGVAVFSHPCNDAVLTRVFPIPANAATELGRFVLLDEVPGNGETWFLARCFEHLRGKVRGVVSFSDPEPRTARDGRIVFPGHIGTIYQAFNARYVGRGKADKLHLLPDGTVFSRRAISKIRNEERGWQHCAATLIQHGARYERGEPLGPWLEWWLPRVTRPLRHPGNHKYVWAVDRRLRPALPSARAYPKRSA